MGKYSRSILILILFAATSLLFSCDDALPPQPYHDNPLDIENPDTGGDPYELTAIIAGGGIKLRWQQISQPQPVGYNIYRRRDEGSYTVLRAEGRVGDYTDTNITNGHRYDYFVIARGSDGEEGDASNVASVSIDTDPVLFIESDTTYYTPTRNVTLTLLAYGAAEMRLANDPDFTDAVWEPFSSTRDWQLTTGEGTKHVYTQIKYANDSQSKPVSDSIIPKPLNATVIINDGVDTTSFRTVTLAISATGAVEMWIENEAGDFITFADGSGDSSELRQNRQDTHFAVVPDVQKLPIQGRSQAGVKTYLNTGPDKGSKRQLVTEVSGDELELDSGNPCTDNIDEMGEWIPFSDTHDWELTTGPGTKTVRVHLRNDFLIEDEAIDVIEPETLVPSLSILPDDSSFINHHDIQLSMSGVGASMMKLSNIADSSSVAWQEYQEIYSWVLSAGDSEKTVFAWYMNDFYLLGDPVTDAISVDTQSEISSFEWASSGADTLWIGDVITFTVTTSDDAFGYESGGIATVTIDDLNPLTLDDIGDGTYELTYIILGTDPYVENATVTASFVDRASNTATPVSSDDLLTVRPDIIWEEHTVDFAFNGALSVCLEDVDGDGDMDVVGATYSTENITWWENYDGTGLYWYEHSVDGDFDGARSVYAEDVDGDGDIDIVGAGSGTGGITWWENLDGIGLNWSEHSVGGEYYYAWSVYAEDVDSDGDMDVLGAENGTGGIAWWENLDGSGITWSEHTVDGTFDSAECVYAEDADGDGDMDVLGAASSTGDIVWWENLGGNGLSWSEHSVDVTFYGAEYVCGRDVDGDGDMDVLGAASGFFNGITWWENLDATGLNWAEHNVDNQFRGANSVFAEDLDGDGDMDILGASYFDGIIWWENLDGTGLNWAEGTVDEEFDSSLCVYADDVDGDGKMDVLGAGENGISWWESR